MDVTLKDHIRALYESEKICAVVELLESEDTNDAELAFILGDCYRQLGRKTKAISYLKRAIASRNSKVIFDASIALSFIYKQNGWFAETENLLSNLVGLTENNCNSLPGWYWVIRSANLLLKEEFVTAVEYLQLALASTDNDPDEIYFNLATAYRAIGDYAAATHYATLLVEVSDYYQKDGREVLVSMNGTSGCKTTE